MGDSQPDGMPRPTEEPTHEAVLSVFTVCEPYTVSDVTDAFPDANRWTIQRRLDTLTDDGKIERKKHAANRVTYWLPPE